EPDAGPLQAARAFVIESPQKKSNAVKVRTAPGIAAPSLLQAAMTQVAMKPFHSLLLPVLRRGAAPRGRRAELYKQGGPVAGVREQGRPVLQPARDLPLLPAAVCRPATIVHKSMSLGELLDGDRMAQSMFDIRFGQDAADKVLCKQAAVCGGPGAAAHGRGGPVLLRVRGGRHSCARLRWPLEETGFVPHSHKVFLVDALLVQVLLQRPAHRLRQGGHAGEGAVDLAKLQPGSQVAFTYSVAWVKSDVKFEDRAKLIKDTSFFPKTLEIHWLSVINSLILVLLLIGFVTVILFRILKKDFASNLEARRRTKTSDNGWKTVHNDAAQAKVLLLRTSGGARRFLAIMQGRRPVRHGAARACSTCTHHGNINSAGIVLYAFTSASPASCPVECSGRLGGERWARNVLLTSSCSPSPLFMVWAVVNSVPGYAPPRRCPGSTVLLLLCACGCSIASRSHPGGMAARSAPPGLDAPCRTKKNPAGRSPPCALTRPWPVHCLIGGFLKASSAVSCGAGSTTNLYGIPGRVYIILLSVTACVAGADSYFQRCPPEDYRWWWRLRGSARPPAASLRAAVSRPSFFYFRSNMSGLLQAVEFLRYSILLCYVFFSSARPLPLLLRLGLQLGPEGAPLQAGAARLRLLLLVGRPQEALHPSFTKRTRSRSRSLRRRMKELSQPKWNSPNGCGSGMRLCGSNGVAADRCRPRVMVLRVQRRVLRVSVVLMRLPRVSRAAAAAAAAAERSPSRRRRRQCLRSGSPRRPRRQAG
uniref:Transmembrane 9 superfamily member n=1 Tax=Macrostomum lignano TaxID=282301 RepID=A0A1I8F623_9PLAT